MSEAPQSTPAPARQVPALSVRSISKSFGSVKALRDISFELYHGEVMGLLGDNGAGKSTLAKCIAGILRSDHGVIAVNGTEVHMPQNVPLAPGQKYYASVDAWLPEGKSVKCPVVGFEVRDQ